MPRCLGRLLLDNNNTPVSKYEGQDKKGFFLPKRCEKESVDPALCDTCIEKRKKLIHDLSIGKWTPTSVQNQNSYLHGMITEEIPSWSRLYLGPKYWEAIQSGLRVSMETLDTAETAVEEAYKGLEMLLSKMPPKKERIAAATAPVTGEGEVQTRIKKRGGRKKKEEDIGTLAPVVTPVVNPVASKPTPKRRVSKKKVEQSPTVLEALNTIVEQEAAETVEPVPPVSVPTTPTPTPPPVPVKKNQPKRVARAAAATGAPAPPILGVVSAVPIPPDSLTVVKVPVKKTTIDGRQVYLQTEKDKVFDLKFKYLGRYDSREDRIVTGYPDSENDT
jgi:hypothetical protein